MFLGSPHRWARPPNPPLPASTPEEHRPPGPSSPCSAGKPHPHARTSSRGASPERSPYPRVNQETTYCTTASCPRCARRVLLLLPPGRPNPASAPPSTHHQQQGSPRRNAAKASHPLAILFSYPAGKPMPARPALAHLYPAALLLRPALALPGGKPKTHPRRSPPKLTPPPFHPLAPHPVLETTA